MIRVRAIIFFAVAASGWPVVASAQPGDPRDMDQPDAAECSAPASLPPDLAGWSAPRVSVTAAIRPGKADKARLEPGSAAVVTLVQTPSVRYAVPPSKPGGSVSFGGQLSFDVPESGTYRVAQDGRSWIDVIEEGKPVASSAHGHGPACSGIAKMVDFGLKPGRHLLQISANGTQALTVMVSSLP